MRKIILSLSAIVLSSALFAAPFGHSIDFEERADGLLLSKVIKQAGGLQAPISYCVYISEDNKHITEEQADRYIKLGIKTWTNYAAAFIKHHAREHEFKEVYNILSHEVKMQKLPACKSNIYVDKLNLGLAETDAEADISFFFLGDKVKKHICPTGDACYGHKPAPVIFIGDQEHISNTGVVKTIETLSPQNVPNLPEILAAYDRIIPNKETIKRSNYFFERGEKDYLSIITHELGHAMGLGDQYAKGIDNSSYIYRSLNRRMAAMAEADFITCDDIDGVVSAVYRYIRKDKTFKSLCNDNMEIVNSSFILPDNSDTMIIPVNTPDYQREILITYEKDFFISKTYTVKTTSDSFSRQGRENLFKSLDFHGYEVSQKDILDNDEASFSSKGKYKETREGRIPIGKWTNTIWLKNKNMQSIVNEFDDNGNLLSSKLYFVENEEIIYSKNIMSVSEKIYLKNKNTVEAENESSLKKEIRESLKKRN
ncbi:hypothetical protein [Parelusimicrobium proximum]|uniref:hypothetical protein n=1 Tax=Parelusimicrobium proximum TaxID=3228953 RepID=UPI003D18440D